MSFDDLGSLDIGVISQRNLERKIELNAEKVINKKQLEQEETRLKRYTENAKLLQSKKVCLERDIREASRISVINQLRGKLIKLNEEDIAPLVRDIEDIKKRIQDLKNAPENTNELIDSSRKQDGESEYNFLVRTGEITGFGNRTEFKLDVGDKGDETTLKQDQMSIVESMDDSNTGSFDQNSIDSDYESFSGDNRQENEDIPLVYKEENEASDDGVESYYQSRLEKWIASRSKLRKNDRNEELPEWEKPHPTIPSSKLNNDFKIPGDIFSMLFKYQKTCVQWLYELYRQKSGGIIGDEMGLGKTIQLIAFLASLHHSGKLKGPVLVVCPATVMKQWCSEIHAWWPPFRTIILHSIGSGMINKKKFSEKELEQLLISSNKGDFSYDQYYNRKKTKRQLEAEAGIKLLANKVITDGHILITTYVGLKLHSDILLDVRWDYVVLDEGHKIRNPDSEISLLCKKVKTPNRIILSGTPIQNSLIELWSLFDFISPGKLGTLPVFEQQFSVPINTAGYANASNIQVHTGYKCAVALKDIISPYLLRRVKSDVAKSLPKKNEMVLFCKMTQFQRNKYLQFLNSDDLIKIKSGKKQSLYGIDILRKICNHPDLLVRNFKQHNASYGDPKRSGKIQVVKQLLLNWYKQRNKALLFTQSRQMLDILEKSISQAEEFANLKYLRMDGTTNVGKRQGLVDRFNNEGYDLFLLTTRVGGVGVNLIGANRIIIFDPDWNPSTDLQARERVWRIGQKREVIIYRLIITGSIEEKIYHRQIFKQFLTNKVLNDPKQKRFFKMKDLHDLFTLGSEHSVISDEFAEEINNQTKQIIKTSSNADDFSQIVDFEGVSKLEGFYNVKEQLEKENDEDSKIMQGILSGGGLATAINHDSIVKSHVTASDEQIVKEANRVAENAVAMLRKSRKATKKYEIGTITWTGRFGKAGKIKKKPVHKT